MPLLQVGFQLARHGEDERFAAGSTARAKGVLRDRTSDVMTPAQLVTFHEGYRCPGAQVGSFRCRDFGARALIGFHMTATSFDPNDAVFIFIDEAHACVVRCEHFFHGVDSASRLGQQLSLCEDRGERVEQEIREVNADFKDATEAFLFQAARLSLLLFPVRGGQKLRAERLARGARVRNLLEISTLPALESRALRDALMHMDERMDEAIAEHGKTICRNYFEARLDSRAATERVLRTFDMAQKSVRILGVPYDLVPIREEVSKVKRALEKLEVRRTAAEQARLR